MVLNTTIEEIVYEIKSGKKDLYETIEHYVKLCNFFSIEADERIFRLEEDYEYKIENLKNKLKDNEDNEKELIEQKYYIEKLDYKIDDLEYLIEELRVLLHIQEKEIDHLKEENINYKEEKEKLEKYIQNVEGIII